MAKVSLRWPHGGTSVQVTGSFNNWKERVNMKRMEDGTFLAEVEVEPGTHEYKFIVDGTTWQYDQKQRFRDDGRGNTNNYIDVSPGAPASASRIKKESTPSKKKREKKSSASPVSTEPVGEPGVKTHDEHVASTKHGESVKPTLLGKLGQLGHIFQKDKKTEPETPAEESEDVNFRSWKGIRWFTNSKGDGAWTTSKHELKKDWKEKPLPGAHLELKKETLPSGSSQVVLRIYGENKSFGPQQPSLAQTFPVERAEKLQPRNTWAWYSPTTGSAAHALQFSSDEEFNGFMEIVETVSKATGALSQSSSD